MTIVSDLARVLRERRRELGLSRTRLAQRSGLSALDIAVWERGERLPEPTDIVLLAEAVGLDDRETRALIDEAVMIDITDPEIDVVIVDGNEPNPNPFSERSRLVRTSPRPMDRILSRLEELKPSRASVPAARRVPPPRAQTPIVRTPRTSRSARPQAPLAERTSSQRVPSHDDGPVTLAEQRAFYRIRHIGTTVALVGLGLVLWWAFGELGDGIGRLFDLFRDTSGAGLTPTL